MVLDVKEVLNWTVDKIYTNEMKEKKHNKM